MQLSTTSTEYVRVPISVTEAGAAVVPTSDAVSMAFMTPGATPGALDFKSATWETDTTTSPDTFYARCLVGPAGVVTLTAAMYDVWVKVEDNPEIPVRKASGRLYVT